MPQQIIIAEQLRLAALLTDERIDEFIVAQGKYQIGDIYLGTVENVLPGIDAAFVNIGESEKNGFIHVSDLGPLRLKKESAAITELLEPRQKVLVQVIKEPTGTKGPRLTGNIALPGRYLVLQPHGQGVNISRKINTETERNRLRALGVLIKPPGSGLLIRTEAENVSEELLIDDLESLLKQSELIQQASEAYSPPVLLNRDDDFIHRILRDHMGPNISKIIVEDPSGIERARKFLGQDSNNIIIEPHNNQTDFLEYYKINSAIHNALKPRVDLPSGGYIIIEPTEALTVIDVNSGSFTRSSNSRETVLWTNCEAAVEIARQLKLRNIGGVIIIDFIDMDSRRDQLQLLEHFTSAIKNDSARPQIAQLTELGLVELTRKRQGQNIYELFGKACPHCTGLGHTAILPEREQLQLSVTTGGLITSHSSTKPEHHSPIEQNNNKRKKNLKPYENESNPSSEDAIKPEIDVFTNNNDSIVEENTPESTTHKTDHEIIGIQMDEDEEYIYSSLGLNPLLLLKTAPTHDNIVVHIIKPGEDAEIIIEEAKQQINNSTKRRKKNRHINRQVIKTTSEGDSSNEEIGAEGIEEVEEVERKPMGEELPTELNTDQTTSAEKVPNEKPLEEVASEETSPKEPEEGLEDPRRRRRRSSAVST